MSKQKLTDKKIEDLRSNFKTLLLKNPNHFGNLSKSKFQVVNSVIGNTYYEQLDCIGYNSELNELYATFLQKQENGYKGNLCTSGSYEYLRFFVNYGSGWLDQGITAVNVHNIKDAKDCESSNQKPLCFTASVPLKDVKRNFCHKEVLPKVRVILSYDNFIPSNPDFRPIWGNILECQVQLKPYIIKFPDIIETDFVAEFIDIATNSPHLTANQITSIVNNNSTKKVSLQSLGPKDKSLSKVAIDYKSTKGFTVSPSRFTYPFLAAELDTTSLTNNNILNIPELDINAILEEFDKTTANTDYEELESVGLEYNREFLTATIRIKRPNGYSGDLCSKGSKEYVAFWIDAGNKCEWEYIGTTAVQVYDLKSNYKGVCYTAILPYNFNKLRQKCNQSNVIRLRAVLSWGTPPSTTNPDQLKNYGNRLDTHIQIKPIASSISSLGSYSILGGIPVNLIDDNTGLTKADAFFAHNGLPVHRDAPFGRRINIQGPSIIGKKYRIQVRETGTVAWSTLVTSLPLVSYNSISGVVTTTIATPDADGYFNYRNDQANINNLLGLWDTNSDALWEVKLDVMGSTDVFIRKIQLNPEAPVSSITIDMLEETETGDCNNYKAGDTISGRFIAKSPYLLDYRLNTSQGINTAIAPAIGYHDTASSPGDVWQLILPNDLPSCGYYVSLHVRDKTIVNSSYVSYHTNDIVSFCVDNTDK